MKIIALTGGIASGKSTVSTRLAEHGAVIVDADRLTRQVQSPGTPELEQIRRRFGDNVITTTGELNRAALGAIVFSDRDALAALNAIVHPGVWRRAKQRFDAAQAADPDAIVIYDVPLLVEASGDRPLHFDRVVVVEAAAAERVRRLVDDRGMTEMDARARITAQADDAQRRAVADVVLDNNGGRADLIRQVDELWSDLTGV